MRKFLSLLFPLLAGCTCQEVVLTPDERAWLAAYAPGAVVAFRSNRGATNTLTVQPRQEWHENTDCNYLEAGPYQPIFSQIVLRLGTQYDDKNRDLVVNLHKITPKIPGDLKFYLAGLECTTPAQLGAPGAKLARQACTLATTGKTYPDAYVFRNGSNGTNRGNQRMQAFYWDKQDGLIRYELADGEVFDRAPR
ncbi:hypothetical protein ACFQ48_00595 [Hymenobacter caeli]|uniref:Lipoprotein n=1 Tax=Hymenobacter caeli TaxID=2735894 RepID=A0ABX2FJN0_9BACT|nr:hypothetical protein [Hymenobacter caeli]NRT17318.1 hypothetical protein [Hymenobacter caeli]